MKGIDVSAHQRRIDWGKVKSAGIEFAMIRAGYGSSANQVDQYFKANADGALANGIHIGFYWFSYALNIERVHAEAELFYQTIKPYLGKIDFPLCYDFEYDTVRYMKQHGVNPTKALATEFAKTFCKDLESKGCYAMNYKNLDYHRNMFDSVTLADIDFWYAQYGVDSPSISGMGIWQYSSSGSVPGISGRCDMDIAYKDYPSIIRNAGLNGYGKNHENNTTPTPAPNPSPSNEIKKGDKVNVKRGANSYEGKSIASFVYDNSYSVDELNGNRAVLDVKGICTAFNVKDLIKNGSAAPATIKAGSRVKLKSGAKTYTGGSIAGFVFNDTWIVSEVVGSRAVIDKNVGGTNSICTPVNVKDLTLV